MKNIVLVFLAINLTIVLIVVRLFVNGSIIQNADICTE